MQADMQGISGQVQDLHSHMQQAEDRLGSKLLEKMQAWAEQLQLPGKMADAPSVDGDRVQNLEDMCAELAGRLETAEGTL